MINSSKINREWESLVIRAAKVDRWTLISTVKSECKRRSFARKRTDATIAVALAAKDLADRLEELKAVDCSVQVEVVASAADPGPRRPRRWWRWWRP